MINHISVVIIASNCEKTLGNTLNSLRDFKEVVVYENNSNDSTILVAKKFKNVKLIQGDFFGFGPTKNKAVSFASNDWILSLDSDEVLSKEFIENLKQLNLDENFVYQIRRSNFYKDYEIKHCWGNDIITRLYNRNKTRFSEKKVHEFVIEDNLNIKLIDGIVRHYPYNSIDDFVVKLNRYSSEFANDNIGKKSSPLKAFFNGIYSFIKTYFLKQGFRDGYIGLVIAFSHMATNFYKYIKLYELNKENGKIS